MKLVSIIIFFSFTIDSSFSSNPYLFVGTYTDKTVEVPAAKGEGIYVYRISTGDDTNHTLRADHSATIPDLYSPSFLDVTNDKRFLYATSESSTLNESRIHGYAISVNPEGKLDYKHIGSWEVGGVLIAHMKIDERDQFVFISMYVCGCVASFKIDQKTGVLEKRNFLKFNESSHVHERQQQPHLHSSVLDPKFRYVYFADLGNDCVYRMDYCSEKGFNESSLVKYPAPPGSGPRHMVIHPVNHKFMYVVCELNNHVIVYNISDDGALEQVQFIPTTFRPTNFTSGAAGIDIAPDGRFLYVSTRFADVVTVYGIAENGTLSLVQEIDSSGKVPRAITFYPPMNVLFVANQETNNIIAFHADPEAGNLAVRYTWSVNTPEGMKVVDMSNADVARMSSLAILMAVMMQILNWFRA